MSTFENINKLLKGNIIKVAKYFNYSEANIKILENDLEYVKKKYPTIYDNLLSCNHNRDKRSILEYAKDLIASWIFEDIILKALTAGGLNVKLAGTDRARVILSKSRVSATSDLEVTINGKTRLVEVMADFGGYWERFKKLELRDDKYLKLVEKSSLLLGISTKNNAACVIDFSKEVDAKYIVSHRPYGYKPAYSIDMTKISFFHFNEKELAKHIIQEF